MKPSTSQVLGSVRSTARKIHMTPSELRRWKLLQGTINYKRKKHYYMYQRVVDAIKNTNTDRRASVQEVRDYIAAIYGEDYTRQQVWNAAATARRKKLIKQHMHLYQG